MDLASRIRFQGLWLSESGGELLTANRRLWGVQVVTEATCFRGMVSPGAVRRSTTDNGQRQQMCQCAMALGQSALTYTYVPFRDKAIYGSEPRQHELRRAGIKSRGAHTILFPVMVLFRRFCSAEEAPVAAATNEYSRLLRRKSPSTVTFSMEDIAPS